MFVRKYHQELHGRWPDACNEGSAGARARALRGAQNLGPWQLGGEQLPPHPSPPQPLYLHRHSGAALAPLQGPDELVRGPLRVGRHSVAGVDCGAGGLRPASCQRPRKSVPGTSRPPPIFPCRASPDEFGGPPLRPGQESASRRPPPRVSVGSGRRACSSSYRMSPSQGDGCLRISFHAGVAFVGECRGELGCVGPAESLHSAPRFRPDNDASNSDSINIDVERVLKKRSRLTKHSLYWIDTDSTVLCQHSHRTL